MSDVLASGIDILDYNLGYIPSSSQTEKKESAPISTLSIAVEEIKPQISGLKQRIKTKHPLLFSIIKWVVGTYYGLLSLFLRNFSFIHYVVRKIQRMKKETSLLKLYQVKLLVLAEDSEGYFTPQLVHCAKKQGVKSVVFPYTFANQLEFLEDAYFHDQTVDKSFLSLLASKIFPKWARQYKGKKLLRWRPNVIFAAELFGKSAPNPWVMNSGFADVIAVESPFMQKYYSKAGIPEKQMVETGFVSLDSLSQFFNNRECAKTEMSQRFQLDLKKPWLVCAVPPSQWPRPGIGFSSYDEFLTELVHFLKTFSDIEVILKFHPRIRLHEARQLCEKLKVPFVEYGTAQLVGVADMYLASVSSTMRWALACGVPTINYDLYAYCYEDFNQTSGLHTVELFSEFKKIFKEVHDHVVEAHAKKEIKMAKSEFGQLDGQCGERILSLFRQLTEMSDRAK